MKHQKLNFFVMLCVSAILCASRVLLPYITLPLTVIAIGFYGVISYRRTISETLIILTVGLVSLLTSYFTMGINIDTTCAALSDFCLVALSGGVIALTMKSGCSYRMVISGGTVAFLSAFLVEFAKLRFYYGLDLIQVLITTPLENALQIYSEFMANAGIENISDIMAQLGGMKWYLIQAMATITPALLIIICAFGSFVTFVLCRKFIFSRYGTVLEKYPHFWELQLPKSASWLLTLLYISTYFTGGSPIAGAVVNIIIILCAMYFVCGISTVDFFFKRKISHWSIRIIIYMVATVVLTSLGVTFFAVILVGIVDGAFDFRHIRARRSEV